MAKSLRSKWKRKMRAVKRVKNLEKVIEIYIIINKVYPESRI